MSEQTHTDRILGSASISAQWCNEALDLVDLLIEKKAMTPAAARPILAALKAVSKDNPFGMVTMIEGEAESSLTLLRARYTGARAGAKFMVEEGRWWGASDLLDPAWVLNPTWNMNEDQFRTQLQRFEAYYKAAAVLWRGSDNDDKLEELSLEAYEGQFGSVCPMAHKPASIYYKLLMRTRAKVAAEIVGLEKAVENAGGERAPVEGGGAR
jgi:hypothetical protein